MAKESAWGVAVILCELDLSGADWTIVAYESEDENMLTIVEEGLSPHPSTGSLISGAPLSFILEENKLIGHSTDPLEIAEKRKQLEISSEWFLPQSMSIRQAGKKANHGLNYDESWNTFSLQSGLSIQDSKKVIDIYRNKAYPKITRNYYKEIQRELAENDRTLVNCLGRKVRLLGDFDGALFRKGYSFKPQSTVFDITRIAFVEADRLARKGEGLYKRAEMLAQVHDSILFQYPHGDLERLVDFCRDLGLRLLRPELEIKGRKFRVGVDLKVGWNWGHMTEVPLNAHREELKEALEKVLKDA